MLVNHTCHVKIVAVKTDFAIAVYFKVRATRHFDCFTIFYFGVAKTHDPDQASFVIIFNDLLYDEMASIKVLIKAREVTLKRHYTVYLVDGINEGSVLRIQLTDLVNVVFV